MSVDETLTSTPRSRAATTGCEAGAEAMNAMQAARISKLNGKGIGLLKWWLRAGSNRRPAGYEPKFATILSPMNSWAMIRNL